MKEIYFVFYACVANQNCVFYRVVDKGNCPLYLVKSGKLGCCENQSLGGNNYVLGQFSWLLSKGKGQL